MDDVDIGDQEFRESDLFALLCSYQGQPPCHVIK